MPNPLSAEMKEALAKFECLSNPDQFKDHIISLFETTAENISKNATSLTDANDPFTSYTASQLLGYPDFVELRDQIVRYTNAELNKVNGDGAAVPTVSYILLGTKPDDWDTDYESYYMVGTKGKYVHVPHASTVPVFPIPNDKYYRKESS